MKSSLATRRLAFRVRPASSPEPSVRAENPVHFQCRRSPEIYPDCLLSPLCSSVLLIVSQTAKNGRVRGTFWEARQLLPINAPVFTNNSPRSAIPIPGWKGHAPQVSAYGADPWSATDPEGRLANCDSSTCAADTIAMFFLTWCTNISRSPKGHRFRAGSHGSLLAFANSGCPVL